MDPEEVMNLYDSCWFSLEIFKKQSQTSNSEANPDQQIQEKPPEAKISRLPTIHVRSKSDQLSSMASFTSDISLSPNSVLYTPHLQTILSGQEAKQEEEEPTTQPPIEEEEEEPKKSRSMRRRTKKGMTKSLSALEFEELKGFMDLGFVFSEEDVNSSLVDIIPGLQRLGKKEGEKQETSVHKSSVSRPYLSEAWEVLDRRKRENPLLNWRIPVLGNEIDMKDSLKWWAHTVATTVR